MAASAVLFIKNLERGRWLLEMLGELKVQQVGENRAGRKKQKIKTAGNFQLAEQVSHLQQKNSQ